MVPVSALRCRRRNSICSRAQNPVRFPRPLDGAIQSCSSAELLTFASPRSTRKICRARRAIFGGTWRLRDKRVPRGYQRWRLAEAARPSFMYPWSMTAGELSRMRWKRFTRPVRELLRGSPGRRFRDFHEARAQERSRVMRAGRVVLGVVLMLAGVLLSMPPLVPGFLVTAAGLALIASQSRRVAHWLDRIERRLRKVVGRP